MTTAITDRERTTDETDGTTEATDAETGTTVEVRPTGHVRAAVGQPRLEFTFAGSTLREFLAAFFEEYDVAELLIAETEAEATAHGWATPPEELPGTWMEKPRGRADPRVRAGCGQRSVQREPRRAGHRTRSRRSRRVDVSVHVLLLSPLVLFGDAPVLDPTGRNGDRRRRPGPKALRAERL